MISKSVDDFKSWRSAARELLSDHVPPDSVHWSGAEQSSLFDQNGGSEGDLAMRKRHSNQDRFKVPKEFIRLAKEVALFVDSRKPDQKWALLYSVLWQLVREGPGFLKLASDSRIRTLNLMRQSVSRDRHKMKAFVRFRCVSKQAQEQQYFSWFEPEHLIIESTAPFFVQRFTGMNWSIFTPVGCAHWNQLELKLSPPVSLAQLPSELRNPDRLDEFWRVYYCSIFNPARLKEQAMRNEMPKKYWKYLPEAECIKALTVTAASRTQAMMDQSSTDSDRVRQKSFGLRRFQNALRS